VHRSFPKKAPAEVTLGLRAGALLQFERSRKKKLYEGFSAWLWDASVE